MPPTIHGHTQPRARLGEMVAANRLAPTLLFAGPPGIGKHLVALELARTLLCQHPEENGGALGGCGHCSHCRLIESGNFPDLHSVSCLDDSGVEAVRDVLGKLHLRSFSGGNRVVIIRDAEFMGLQAANVLLKTLEEPRPGTYFILSCANPSKLPQTLLSRCQIWFFQPLSESETMAAVSGNEALSSALSNAKIPKSELALLAEGSLENLKYLGEHLELWEAARDALESARRNDLKSWMTWASAAAKDKATLRVVLQLMRVGCRQQMFKSDNAAGKARWALVLNELISAEQLIFERNLSAPYVLNHIGTMISPAVLPDSFTTLSNGVTLLAELAR